MSIGSLFAGIGGFDLAARWMGWETKWFSEIEPYASAVLKKHWPNVPNHGDITQIRGDVVEKVDILCGGFPCQDISLAGKGAGIEGARSGLWSHYARLIEEIRPRYVVAENVSALRSRGLDKVLREVSAFGYDAEWHCIPASYVGAPHRRDRIWIVAWRTDSHGMRCEGITPRDGEERTLDFKPRRNLNGLRLDVADSDGERQTHLRESETRSVIGDSYGRRDTAGAGSVSGRSSSEWWSVEPNVGRVANGVSSRVDRLRCLGNAIVPQVAYLVFQAIQERERSRS